MPAPRCCDILLVFAPIADLTPDDLAFFGARIWQILTSCKQRRLGEYERTSWWEFVGAEQRSAPYQKFLATGITRSLVAAKARKASTRTIGDIFVQLVLTILNPIGGSTDRVLDGPTNLVWIDPWLAYLESSGVQYVTEAEVEEILCELGRITGVVARQQGKRTVVRGDHYVAALPLEDIAPMVNSRLAAADPTLANLRALAPNLEWMNGVQFYLHRAMPSTHGHVVHIDTEWALTSISQLQFWRNVPPELFGDSDVHGILSVDISDWTEPGSNGRPAMQCSREEVVRETWLQLKRSLNDAGDEVLRDEDLHSWFLDPDIENDPARPGWLRNSEPLLVNLVDTWALRPEATTAIPNLFLASDYVRTHTDLATMEGANEAARRAVNGLLDAVKFDGSRCEVWPLHEPEILAPWRLYDAARYQAGLPWDNSLVQVAAHAIRGASPLLEQAAPIARTGMRRSAMPLADTLDPRECRHGGRQPACMRRPDGGRAQLGRCAHFAGRADQGRRRGASGRRYRGPGGFLDRLGWYRDMLAETLAEGVPTWEPQRHLYGLVKDFIDRSGKGFGPPYASRPRGARWPRRRKRFPSQPGWKCCTMHFSCMTTLKMAATGGAGSPQCIAARVCQLPLIPAMP